MKEGGGQAGVWISFLESQHEKNLKFQYITEKTDLNTFSLANRRIVLEIHQST